MNEDYVSFETAKLLKEKGFDEPVYRGISINNLIFVKEEPEDFNHKLSAYCSQPTLQMAMKWLREVHNIGISVVPHSYKEGKPFDYEFEYWNSEEYHTPYNEKHPTYHELFGKTWEKYEEACEAGIKYCLENLI